MRRDSFNREQPHPRAAPDRQFTMSRDGRDGVCQSRLVAMTPSVSVIMSPPVPRLTSNFGNAEEAISTRSRCPVGGIL